jgi:hypothetical protein
MLKIAVLCSKKYEKKTIYLTIRNGQTLQNIFLVITDSVKIWVVP